MPKRVKDHKLLIIVVFGVIYSYYVTFNSDHGKQRPNWSEQPIDCIYVGSLKKRENKASD